MPIILEKNLWVIVEINKVKRKDINMLPVGLGNTWNKNPLNPAPKSNRTTDEIPVLPLVKTWRWRLKLRLPWFYPPNNFFLINDWVTVCGSLCKTVEICFRLLSYITLFISMTVLCGIDNIPWIIPVISHIQIIDIMWNIVDPTKHCYGFEKCYVILIEVH